MKYTLLNKFLYRTPIMPLSALSVLERYSWDDIFLFIEETLDTNAIFTSALKISSPDFFKSVLKTVKEKESTSKIEKDKIAISFLKYYLRACSRPTPFGLFAGCGIGHIEHGKKSFIEKDNFTISNRLDMGLACFIAKQLMKNIYVRENITYKVNTSLYEINKEYRFMKVIYDSATPEYKLSSCQKNPLIAIVFKKCQKWKPYLSILDDLVALGIPQDQGKLFLDEIIEDQFLASELTPNITGMHFFESLVDVLKNAINRDTQVLEHQIAAHAEAKKQYSIFKNWLGVLENAKGAEIALAIDLIKQDLAALEIDFDSNNLIQTDLFRKDETVYISNKVEKQIFEGIDILNSMVEGQKINHDEFKMQYEKKYERRMLPLTQILDNDFGIGFGKQLANFKEASPIVEGLDYSINNNEPVDSNKTLTYKIKKQIEAALSNNALDVIVDNDFEKNNAPEKDYGDHFAIILNIHRTEPNLQISFSSIFPNSGPNLLGRFSYLSPLIEDLLNEQRSSIHEGTPSEIVHMPGERVGNILHRNIMTKKEIEYLSKSLLPHEKIITIRDIYISRSGNYFKIFNKKTGEMIIPTNSNAQAYNENNLPIFNFLRSLSIVGKDYVVFYTNYKPFSPRISYKNVIFAPAKWQLAEQDIQFKSTENFATLFNSFQKWKGEVKLPKYVFVEGDNDNEILINTEQEVFIRILFDELHKKKIVTLKEFIGDMDSLPISDNENQTYASQYVLLFKRNSTGKDIPQKMNFAMPAKAERFIPINSNWLYFKIYAGPSIQDRILLDCLYKTVKSSKVLKFFFTRYYDTDLHLRVRLLFQSVEEKTVFWNQFEKKILPLINQSLIYSVQIENYKREIERYSEARIDYVETAFSYDSRTVLEYLRFEDENNTDRWKFGLKYIQMILDVYFEDLTEKRNYCDSMFQVFLSEQPNKRISKVLLSGKFKNMRQEIMGVLNDPDTIYDNLLNRDKNKIRKSFSDIFKGVEDKNNEIFASIIHMNINRLFQTRQRIYEMSLYYFLSKYYDYILNTQPKNG